MKETSLRYTTSSSLLLIAGCIGMLALPRMATLKAAPAYPIKVHSSRRYLIDQNNKPFPIFGDSGWDIIAYLNPTDQKGYFADRSGKGFNCILTSLLCWTYIKGKSDASSYDGKIPFTTPGDLTTPNPAYWSEIDSMVSLAATYNLCMILVVSETGINGIPSTNSWLTVFRSAGTKGCFNYGVFLGNRYKNRPNIIWEHGNDYTISSSDDLLLRAVIDGIRSVDSNHIHTAEVDKPTSTKFARNDLTSDDPTLWANCDFNFAYTAFPSYATCFLGYNLSGYKPVILGESTYESEGGTDTDAGTPLVLRRQEWWASLAGTAGQLYGNHYTWLFGYGGNNWRSHLSDTGTVQLTYLFDFFSPLQWYNLLPDHLHTFVTAGHGSSFTKFSASTARGTIPADTYQTAALSLDRSLGIVYAAAGTRVTVDMSKMSGLSTARWFDPSNNTYTTISESPFPNTGTHNFSTPGKNHAGDTDWILVLTSNVADPGDSSAAVQSPRY
jgi:hypothetical protein